MPQPSGLNPVRLASFRPAPDYDPPDQDPHPERGPRTFEIVMGLGKDEKNGSFDQDFTRVIDHGFRTCAFPPANPETTFSIPTGFSGTTRLNPSPNLIDVPEARSLEQATAEGSQLLLSNIQHTLDSIFSQTSPKDTFVLYISSHGWSPQGIYRFAMSFKLSFHASSPDAEGNSLEEFAEPRITLALKDLDFSKCRAGSLVILADTCYSTTMVQNMEDQLKDHPGNIVLIGSAPEVAQDWRGENGQQITTSQGTANVPQGGVFTSQFLEALANPTLHGDLYSVMKQATTQASEVANTWSQRVTGNSQQAQIWTRPNLAKHSETQIPSTRLQL